MCGLDEGVSERRMSETGVSCPGAEGPIGATGPQPREGTGPACATGAPGPRVGGMIGTMTDPYRKNSGKPEPIETDSDAEYQRLMAARQRLLDQGHPESTLLKPLPPIARNQAEVDAQIESVQGPKGRVTRTCQNTQCRVETFAPFRGDTDGYCPSCYGSGS